MPKKTKNEEPPPPMWFSDPRPMWLRRLTANDKAVKEYFEERRAMFAAMVGRLEDNELALTISPMGRLLAFKVTAETASKQFDFYIHVPLFNAGPFPEKYGFPDWSEVGTLAPDVPAGKPGKLVPPTPTKETDTSIPFRFVVSHTSDQEYPPGFNLIGTAINEYILFQKQHETLLKAWYPNKRGQKARKYFPDIEKPYDRMDQKDLKYFGGLLKQILESIGYDVTIKLLKFEIDRWKAPTMDHMAQRFFTADKRGNFLSDLMALRRKVDEKFDPFEYDKRGQNIIGFKIGVDIPSQKHIEESTQLSFSFDFKTEDGYDLIPIKDLEKQEIKDKLNETLASVERDISKDQDPLTLRIKDALICLAQEKGRWNYYYTEDELMDLLYERSRAGYHAKVNRDHVRNRLPLVEKIRLSYGVKIGGETWGIEDAPYIILNPGGKPFVEIRGRGRQKKKRYNFQSVQVSEPYQKLFSSKGYLAQYEREALKLKGAAYSLYKYISTWWRIGWQKDQGVYEWNLRDIIDGAGIAVPRGSQKARNTKKIIGYLDEMVGKGFMKSYERLNNHKDPIHDKWRFEAPDELKAIYAEMGAEYREAQELKAIKREKKKLKQQSEVIDLKKKIGKTTKN